MHRRLKEALKARLSDAGWINQLPWVLLGIRATIKEDLKAAPDDLVYSTPILVPGDVLPKLPAEFLQQLRSALRPHRTTCQHRRRRQ